MITIGTRWYSFKHNAWAIVTEEAVTDNGYYTIQFPEVPGMYRRYNEQRIYREIAQQDNIDSQLTAQGVVGGQSAVVIMNDVQEVAHNMPAFNTHSEGFFDGMFAQNASRCECVDIVGAKVCDACNTVKPAVIVAGKTKEIYDFLEVIVKPVTKEKGTLIGLVFASKGE